MTTTKPGETYRQCALRIVDEHIQIQPQVNDVLKCVGRQHIALRDERVVVGDFVLLTSVGNSAGAVIGDVLASILEFSG